MSELGGDPKFSKSRPAGKPSVWDKLLGIDRIQAPPSGRHSQASKGKGKAKGKGKK